MEVLSRRLPIGNDWGKDAMVCRRHIGEVGPALAQIPFQTLDPLLQLLDMFPGYPSFTLYGVRTDLGVS